MRRHGVREHLVEPLPVHAPRPVQLRDHHVRIALDLALRVRTVRRADEPLHVGERLGRILRGGLARMVLVGVGVMPRIDEQLLRTPLRGHLRECLLHHLAVGDIARRVVVVGHVAHVRDQVHAHIAEHLVRKARARTARLRLADVCVRHHADLEKRGLRLRRPKPRRERRERRRAAKESSSCRLHLWDSCCFDSLTLRYFRRFA